MRITSRRFGMMSAAAVSAMALPMLAGGGVTASAAAAHPEAISAAGPAEPGGTWGQAMNVPGLAALNTGGSAAIVSVSCVSPGNCGAGGSYADGATKTAQPFVVSETNGAWGQASEVPGVTGLGSGGSAETGGSIASVSCSSLGNCAAAGSYRDRAGDLHAFVDSETAGTWGGATAVRGSIGTTSNITALSCASAGDCSAVGYYVTTSGSSRVVDPFVVDETGGIWGVAQQITGFASLNPIETLPTSVSCASPGNCGAGGLAQSSTQRQAWVVDETGGTWGIAEEVPGVAGLSAKPVSQTTAVSCPAPGDCSATGYYLGVPAGVAFIANETNGVWAPAQPVPDVPAPNAGQGFQTASLSCSSSANCTISGTYLALSAGVLQPFVASEVNGTVGAAEEVPGTGALNHDVASAPSVSCTATGYCATGGRYIGAGNSGAHAYVATESGGTWGTALAISGLQTPQSHADTEFLSVSCTATGYCSAGGDYLDRSGKYQAFVVGEATASATTLTQSAGQFVYGHEQTKRLSATVTSPAGGTPTGTVTVTAGPATICTMTLTVGTGTCTPSATGLAAGTYSLTATYDGDTNYAVSRSAANPVTVTKAPTGTSLALSRATVTYGHETTEHLTVTVTPHYLGTPGGKVIVRAGKATVCVITLSKAAKGTCTLTARQLRAGTYTLTARYDGNANFATSASQEKRLKITG